MIRMESACVAEQGNNNVSIDRIGNPSIVSLRVSRKMLDGARDNLQLASPSGTSDGDPRSLWIGPDHWLLVSNSMTPASIVSNCKESFGETLYNALDYSAGLSVLRISGANARELLATGSGLDFRAEEFPIGTCCRTRFAQIAAIVISEGEEQFDIYVDRSYEAYLRAWLMDYTGYSRSLLSFELRITQR